MGIVVVVYHNKSYYTKNKKKNTCTLLKHTLYPPPLTKPTHYSHTPFQIRTKLHQTLTHGAFQINITYLGLKTTIIRHNKCWTPKDQIFKKCFISFVVFIFVLHKNSTEQNNRCCTSGKSVVIIEYHRINWRDVLWLCVFLSLKMNQTATDLTDRRRRLCPFSQSSLRQPLENSLNLQIQT